MSEYRLEVEVSQDNAIQTLSKLQAKLDAVSASGTRAEASAKKAGSGAAAASKGFNLLSQTSSNAGEGMVRLSKQSGDLNGSLMLLTKSVLSYEIAARAIRASDEYLGMSNRLKLVTQSQEELQVALDRTFSISQKTGSIWSTNVQIYQRFLDVAKDVNKTQAEIGDITETVAKAVAMSGATAESANAAMVQFSQGMASGVLRGEEFNSVAEQTPALLDAIARGLNKRRADLRAMANEGKLTTEVVMGALEASAESTDALFGRMELGVSATFNKLRNSTTQWVGEMNEASGASGVLVGALNMLAQNLDGAVFLVGVAALTSLTGRIVASTSATMADISAKTVSRTATIAEIEQVGVLTTAKAAETSARVAAMQASVAEARASVAAATTAKAEAIAKGVLATREAQLATATTANTAALGAQTAAATTLAAATSRLALAKQAALAVFGGPAGLITLGVSAAAMYLLLRKNTDESAEAAEQHAKYINLSREAIEKLNSAQKDNAIDVLTDSLEKQNAELKRAQSQFAGYINDVASGLAQAGRSQELAYVYDQLRQVREGTISFADAIDNMNQKDLLTPDQRSQLLLAEGRYAKVFAAANDAATGLEKFGEQARIAGSEANNTALKNDILKNSMLGVENAADRATAAMKKYQAEAEKDIKVNEYIVTRVNGGASLDQATAESKYFAATDKAPDALAIELIKKRVKAEADVAKIKADQTAASRSAAKAEKAAASEAKQRAREAARELERRQKEYQTLLDNTRNAGEKAREEFSKFKTLWQEFGGGDQTALNNAQARMNEQLTEYNVSLKEYKRTYLSYFEDENAAVNARYDKELTLLANSTKVTQEERSKMHNELINAWVNEIDMIRIREEYQRLEAKKTFLTEMEYQEQLLQLKYQDIDAQPNLSPEQKDTRKAIANNEFVGAINSQRESAWNDYVGVMGSNPTAQDELKTQLDAQREIIQAAREQGLIDQETYLDALEQKEREYMMTTQQLWATTWGDSLDGWASFFQNVQGENSAAYKAIFSLQKAFSIATAALNIQKAISDGWATGADIYTKMASVATIITQTGTILSDISSISMNGYKSGGYTGNYDRNAVVGVVHGSEFVMPAEKTSQYRSQLESMKAGTFGQEGSGSVVLNSSLYITINNDGSSQQQSGDTDVAAAALQSLIGKMISKELEQGGSIRKFVNSIK